MDKKSQEFALARIWQRIVRKSAPGFRLTLYRDGNKILTTFIFNKLIEKEYFSKDVDGFKKKAIFAI